MLFLLLILLAGIGSLVYGIYEQKNVHSNPHFAEADVVGHNNVRSTNLALTAMNAAVGIVHPVVGIELENGIRKVIPLHNQVSRKLLEQFPELDIGGKVSVTYFGEDPKEAFLTGHPLAQTPMTCSPVLLISIVIWVCVIGMTVLYLCIR